MFDCLNKLRESEYSEQVFLCTVYVASIVVAFLFGYIVFRYDQLHICKTEIEVLPEINQGGKS